MSKNTVLVPLLEGFEEIEAVTIIDVLRRADVPVITASDKAGPVQGSHGTRRNARGMDAVHALPFDIDRALFGAGIILFGNDHCPIVSRQG